MSADKHEVRREYEDAALSSADLAADPLQQFSLWMQAAEERNILDATAMTLATVDADGQPQARIVLLKAYGAEGFTFYTDTRSAKGLQMQHNARVSLLFYWRELERQVRICGRASRLDDAAAQAYFASRPRDSQLSAAASEQSRPIASRQALEARVAELQARYPEGAVPKPDAWGGYVVQAESYEFWQGRVGRLHDRFFYLADSSGRWSLQRLQP